MDEETHDQTVVTSIPESEEVKEKHAYVIFLSGPLVGKIHLLEEGTVTLGRGNDVEIPVNDLGISRHHVSISYAKGKASLKDLGSTNGTYLNGHRVHEASLADGDKIQISSATIMKFAYQDKIENIFHKELYKMAVVDALTSAYNKRYFEDRLKEEFSYCQRNAIPLSLMIFDLDHFKNVNDTQGHPAGDFILASVCQLARSVIRNEDILARYGGEEFTIILKGTDGPGATMLAERLRQLVEESGFEFDGKNLQVTVSIGVTTLVGKNLPNYEAMIKQADEHLYQSKNSGRNRVTAG